VSHYTTISVCLQKIAEKHGCHQVLWLYGPDEEITEVGAMNIFFVLDHGDRKELVTPSLDKGIILPGVVRRSIVELAQKQGEMEVSERSITMEEVLTAKAENRLLEVFGSGTAAVVSPVGGFYYKGRMVDIPAPVDGVSASMMRSLSDIFYGRAAEHPWAPEVEDWQVSKEAEAEDYRKAAQQLEIQANI